MKGRMRTRQSVEDLDDDELAHCIGCGCDQINACDGGCEWLRVDHAHGRGVCSECEQHLERWDAGRRRFSPRANENRTLSMWLLEQERSE